MRKLKILELYAGSRSFGKVAESLGHKVFSVDWTAYEGIDLVIDIETLTIEMIPFVPDIIWDSRDCTTYTIAAISHHRNGVIPKTKYAEKCDRTNTHVNGLIEKWICINPELKFYIENPRGMMRKMPFMQNFERTTVWYCTYGDDRAKPTDIWSNNIFNPLLNPNGWMPRPQCHNGNKNCHHQSAPRGSKTGTQGRKNAHERSRIPEQLFLDILKNNQK